MKKPRELFGSGACQHHLKTEMISVSEIVGRICAKEVVAPLSIQPFDNSAMDGFAVRRDDLRSATGEATGFFT